VSVVEVSVDVDAPPEKVWEVVSDPRNLPQWDRRISRVDGVPEDGLREGSEYETELRVLGAKARTTSKVIETPRLTRRCASGVWSVPRWRPGWNHWAMGRPGSAIACGTGFEAGHSASWRRVPSTCWARGEC
jgi:hypothetical protein